MDHEHRPPFGFILSRCVQKPFHNGYWKEAHRCIRELFPKAPIVVIDDHSDPLLLHPDVPLDDETTFVQSSFPKGRGEFLPYHYFYTHAPFDKAVMLHDSMFLQEREPLLSVLLDDDVHFKFLWFFTRCRLHMKAYQHILIDALPTSERNPLRELLETQAWFGCFGACSVIKLSYLQKLHDKYGLMNLGQIINSRKMRMGFERVIALCCIASDDMDHTVTSISVYGNIDHHERAFKYRFPDYMNDKAKGTVKEPCVKIWSGR